MRQSRVLAWGVRLSGVLLMALVFLFPPGRSQAQDQSDLAQASSLASQRLLTAITRAGNRLVAVGARGHIILSDDEGRTWRQAQKVPTRVLLTAVSFVDARRGWAGGHDAVILVTRDGGETWALQHRAPDLEAPVLGFHFLDPVRGLAVGAFGLVLETDDNGATWRAGTIDGNGPPGFDAPVELSSDGHLNTIFPLKDGSRLVAGEFGRVFRADRATRRFKQVPSGYEGSLWGGIGTPTGTALLFGMRGTVLRSGDGGATWTRIPLDTRQSLSGAALLANGGIALVGLSGTIAVSLDDGQTFTVLHRADRKNLTDVVGTRGSALVAVGEAGVVRLHLDQAQAQARR